MLSKIKRRIRNVFITGLLITLPVAITFFILKFLFLNLDALSPVFTKLLITVGAPIPEGYRIPFLGFAMTFLIILLAGMLTTNIFGKKLLYLGEAIVAKIPFVRSIYRGTKQVVVSFANADTDSFKKVVLIEFPRKGLHAIGFVTGETRGEVQDHTADQVINVFVPTTPNPTSGFLIFAPKDEVQEIAMSIEDGIKYVVSGGIVDNQIQDLLPAIDIKETKV
ncbi:MAG: DUF502 domain-containing protein [Nitrospinae bacterium]|nr:DUF502 domain-containing protein [Nitrospinota bacterium]